MSDYYVRKDGDHRDSGEPGVRAAPPPSAVDDLYDSPAFALGLSDPRVIERLGAIDDLVFEAIAGKQTALDDLRRQWAQVPELIGARLVEESRQAYLRHALSKWRECVDDEPTGNPRLAVTLMDVLDVLLH